jgi:hypothetical protein
MPTNYTVDEKKRSGIRAYLQRCEVRLSTMHRVAGIFLNGSGLLILFPIFFKDAFIKELSWSLKEIFGTDITKVTLALGTTKMILGSCVLISVIMSLLLPVLSLYNLLKEIAWFYFMPHVIRFRKESKTELFHPRFTISALAFPIDERGEDNSRSASEDIKEEIDNSNLRGNLFKGDQDPQRKHMEDILARDSRIIPPTRIEKGKGKFDPGHITDEDIYNAQFGLAGGSDLTLIQEVAQVEASLIRNSLSLRRLVLRYLKSLLMLTWTVFISFIVNYIALEEKSIIPEQLKSRYILIIYLFWFLLTPFIFKLPIYWIQSHGDSRRTVQDHYRDPDLVKYEELVRKICWIMCLFIAGLLFASYEVILGLCFVGVGLFLLLFSVKNGSTD